MKYVILFFVALMLGCSKEEAVKTECRLSKITVSSSAGGVTETSYTYSSNGKMSKQVRTRNSAIVFDYTYFYNSNGKVEKVDMVDSYSQYEYLSNGRTSTITSYSSAGTLLGKDYYTWTGDNLEIKFTKPELTNQYQLTLLEFSNNNVIKRTIISYTGKEPNVITNKVETVYQDFDSGITAFYIAKPTREGFSEDNSKNNARKIIETSTPYIGGAPSSATVSTTILSYTYNSSNATITSTSTLNGTFVVNSTITYDGCSN